MLVPIFPTNTIVNAFIAVFGVENMMRHFHVGFLPAGYCFGTTDSY